MFWTPCHKRHFCIKKDLMCQLSYHQTSQQTSPTTSQLDTCSTAPAVPLVGRLVQHMGPQPKSDPCNETRFPGHGYFPHHLISAMTEPAHHAASGLSSSAMGQGNGLSPASGILSQHYVSALVDPANYTARIFSSPAYQNHELSINQVQPPVGGGSFAHKQQPGVDHGSGTFPSWWTTLANSVACSLYNPSSLTHQNHAKSSNDSNCRSESGSEELD
jgi:hypothetical protein